MDVGQIGGKNFVYIVELHVKLRPKRIKIVEMRAKSVLFLKIRRFSMNFYYFSIFAHFCRHMIKKYKNVKLLDTTIYFQMYMFQ